MQEGVNLAQVRPDLKAVPRRQRDDWHPCRCLKTAPPLEAIIPGVPRTKVEDLPEDVRELVEALRSLAGREGMTRAKIAGVQVLLALSDLRFVGVSTAEQARATEDAIRTQVNAIPNLSDRALLIAGLNLDGLGDSTSSEARINELVYSSQSWKPTKAIDSEGAIGRFRSQLMIELAWRLLGGAPLYALPRPPSDDLDLVARLRRQNQDDVAVPLLQKIAMTADDDRDRRDAWRLLATIAYESGEYDGAELAFDRALQYRDGTRRGGKLAVAIDRYARRLTDEEEYDRALEVVSRALTVYFDSRWLWRRYGCVKWYAGDLLDAYAALTHALDIGYPASRVFHARGQVLAELGQYERAIEELSEALKVPRSSVSRAVALSARAFAVGMSGDLSLSLADFEIAERSIPESGWLHYWKALCLLEHGRIDEGLESLERALRATSPILNRLKRERASQLLATLSP